MNRELSEMWVTEKLLPNLEESSLTNMDNTAYNHSALAEKGDKVYLRLKWNLSKAVQLALKTLIVSKSHNFDNRSKRQ
ncbi:hypothetical protein NQ315_002544 [Exocentrus adspersus]|uniref:Uncharacterized protein n=1 Tax=Exocentrus adspersus TaxID=1586481 RepID=A0AAV8VFH4_9CUCU|nr:hypothetical protein NQ315_002544 [Exocentrus adspersus]